MFEFTNDTLKTHNGAITIENTNTGQHRTFHIRTMPPDSRFAPGRRIVELRTGPEWEDRHGFGFVDDDGTIQLWRRRREAPWTVYAKMLESPDDWKPKGAVYHFEGRCRRCNRTLTVPASIRAGIGPVCAEVVGIDLSVYEIA